MHDTLKQQLIAWRRDFHRHPEQGFLEMRTASIVADELARLGYRLRMGREVMDSRAIMGKPDAQTTAAHAAWARANGAVATYLDALQDGYTAVVADWDSGKPGPTTALRVDMDALPIHESDAAEHRPQALGFRSQNPGSMHACGHDGHSAIGLAVATLIAENRAALAQRFPGAEIELVEHFANVRGANRDYFPMVGPVAELADACQRFAGLRHDARALPREKLTLQPGLYYNVGLGSKGYSHSWLNAQLLHSLLSGAVLPLSREVLPYVYPSRFILRALKRRQL